jgi:hypothetical protein
MKSRPSPEGVPSCETGGKNGKGSYMREETYVGNDEVKVTSDSTDLSVEGAREELGVGGQSKGSLKGSLASKNAGEKHRRMLSPRR